MNNAACYCFFGFQKLVYEEKIFVFIDKLIKQIEQSNRSNFNRALKSLFSVVRRPVASRISLLLFRSRLVQFVRPDRLELSFVNRTLDESHSQPVDLQIDRSESRERGLTSTDLSQFTANSYLSQKLMAFARVVLDLFKSMRSRSTTRHLIVRESLLTSKMEDVQLMVAAAIEEIQRREDELDSSVRVNYSLDEKDGSMRVQVGRSNQFFDFMLFLSLSTQCLNKTLVYRHELLGTRRLDLFRSSWNEVQLFLVIGSSKTNFLLDEKVRLESLTKNPFQLFFFLQKPGAVETLFDRLGQTLFTFDCSPLVDRAELLRRFVCLAKGESIVFNDFDRLNVRSSSFFVELNEKLERAVRKQEKSVTFDSLTIELPRVDRTNVFLRRSPLFDDQSIESIGNENFGKVRLVGAQRASIEVIFNVALTRLGLMVDRDRSRKMLDAFRYAVKLNVKTTIGSKANRSRASISAGDQNLLGLLFKLIESRTKREEIDVDRVDSLVFSSIKQISKLADEKDLLWLGLNSSDEQFSGHLTTNRRTRKQLDLIDQSSEYFHHRLWNLSDALHLSLNTNGFNLNESIEKKFFELNRFVELNGKVIVLGPSEVGKTNLIRVLVDAHRLMNKDLSYHLIYLDLWTESELFGSIDEKGKIFRRGLIDQHIDSNEVFFHFDGISTEVESRFDKFVNELDHRRVKLIWEVRQSMLLFTRLTFFVFSSTVSTRRAHEPSRHSSFSESTNTFGRGKT